MFSRLRGHVNGSEEWNVRIAGYQQGQAEAAPVGGETIEAGEKNEKSCRITEISHTIYAIQVRFRMVYLW